MAVSTPTFAIVYTGNGSDSIAYTIPFPFLENAHIFAAVSADGVADPVTLDDSAYNVSRLDDGSGGSLLTAAAVTAPATITIWRKVPLTQPTEFQAAGPFPSKSAETALDRLEMQIQQIAGEGVAVPPTGGDTVADVLSWANDAARAAKRATRAGQLGVQLNDQSVWRSTSTTAGAWVKTGTWQKEWRVFAADELVPATVTAGYIGTISQPTAIKSISIAFTGGGTDGTTFTVYAGGVTLATGLILSGGDLPTYACVIPDTLIPAGTVLTFDLDVTDYGEGMTGMDVVFNCANF